MTRLSKAELSETLFRDQSLAFLFLWHAFATTLLNDMRQFVCQDFWVFRIARFGKIDVVAKGKCFCTHFLAGLSRIAAGVYFDLAEVGA